MCADNNKSSIESSINFNASIKLDFKVNYSFNVYFGRNIIANEKLFEKIFYEKERAKLILFVEDKIAYQFPDLSGTLLANFAKIPNLTIPAPPLIMPGGERNKTLEQAIEACSEIAENKICRHSFVSILGGGAFLDTISFAASIAHRGVRQVRFPTTVVSQCDSGIGVKNSINLFGTKNYAGTFFPPYAVVNDFDFIDTLPLREKIAGVAEAIKVAIIKDKNFFDFLKGNSSAVFSGEPKVFEELVFRCAKIHAEHISQGGDPFEFGNSRPLDFGHWIAHKLESMSAGRIRHGEAVSVGIAADSFLAMKKGLISDTEFDEIISLLKSCGLPIWSKYLLKSKDGKAEILSGLDEFREHLGGTLSITLPKSIGDKIEISEVDESVIIEGFSILETLQK